jgi:Tfp pilus assembly protein PilN
MDRIQNINLRESGRSDPGTRLTGERLGIAAALLALAIATHAALIWRDTASAKASLARTRGDVEHLTRARAELAAPSAAWVERVAREEAEVTQLEAMAQQIQQGAWGRTEGFSPSLRALGRSTAPGIWLTGVTVDNPADSLSLDGRAQQAWQVPGLLHALQGQARFSGLALAALNLSPGEGSGPGSAAPVAFHLATPGLATPDGKGALAQEHAAGVPTSAMVTGRGTP